VDSQGAILPQQPQPKELNMSNNDQINEAIAILQTMNMEDCAQSIDNLRNELERVKGIAGRRLDRIAQLQHDVAVLEDKLEDTRSDVRYIQEATGRALTR